MIELKTGMPFCTANPMALGRAIDAAEKFWSADNEAEYSHAGIIVDASGKTFESLWTIRYNHLSAYADEKILIGELTEESGVGELSRLHALNAVIAEHQGQIYPFWRLPLQLLPPLAKYISTGRFPVCSELTAEYLKLAGLSGVGRWQGKNPDHIADWIRRWRSFRVVYEGLGRGVFDTAAAPVPA